ncbi:MAG: YqgE/AlgH family protein [Pseudomonadales bacterium]|nr:YqgE/AlgH family protein [Pseudomonadales bacterium]
MDQESSLKNHFLIAMPHLVDPTFSHTITFVCEHNDNGAMGIVINRPLELCLGDIFRHIDVKNADLDRSNDIVYNGGPVQTDRGFVIHNGSPKWKASLQVTDEINMTTSIDILEAIAHNKGPSKYLVALGYAGWDAGQLDEEMAANAWLSIEASPEIIFDTPFEQRWQAAATTLGVDLNLLSTSVGHA